MKASRSRSRNELPRRNLWLASLLVALGLAACAPAPTKLPADAGHDARAGYRSYPREMIAGIGEPTTRSTRATPTPRRPTWGRA